MDRPFTERIAAAAPELWERFLRAVERERRQGQLIREMERPKKDRSDYFRKRYEAQKATGLCKFKSCGNPSGKFVLCIFHRAAQSFGGEKKRRATV